MRRFWHRPDAEAKGHRGGMRGYTLPGQNLPAHNFAPLPPFGAPMRRAWIALLMCPLAALAQGTAPDSARQFTAERMWALKRLGDPAITPDGKFAVLAVTSYAIPENKGLADLWMLPVAGGTARQLTSDRANDTQPVVSPDG